MPQARHGVLRWKKQLLDPDDEEQQTRAILKLKPVLRLLAKIFPLGKLNKQHLKPQSSCRCRLHTAGQTWALLEPSFSPPRAVLRRFGKRSTSAFHLRAALHCWLLGRGLASLPLLSATGATKAPLLHTAGLSKLTSKAGTC